MSVQNDSHEHHFIGIGFAVAAGLTKRGLSAMQIATLGKSDAASKLVFDSMRERDCGTERAWNAMLDGLVALAETMAVNEVDA